MIKPEGTGLKQLTFGDVNDTQPAVSPDGTQFAFNREQFPRDVEARSIWVKDLTTGKETPITSDTDYPYGPYTSANPTWSPDGSRIAFERSIAEDRDGPGKFTRIWILDVVPAVGSPVRLTPESGVGLLRPSWSPDGRSLLYMRSLWPDGPYAVYRLDLPSRSEEQVISTGNDYVPRWSPDGSRMLWTSYKLSERGDVFITDLARPSDSQFRLTPYSGWAEAAWSPDGSKLVLVSSSIKLSDNSLASLQSIGFREEMLSKLSVLKGREFVRAEDFLAALTATIGEAAAIRYADKIAQHSDPNERLWITNADGSNFVQLTPMPLLLNGLCWARIFQSKKAQ
jgi:dipeptidyl aminopeptidase/acylaminoacyl peptidase